MFGVGSADLANLENKIFQYIIMSKITDNFAYRPYWLAMNIARLSSSLKVKKTGIEVFENYFFCKCFWEKRFQLGKLTVFFFYK